MVPVKADEVHDTLKKHMLVDGYDLVYDPWKSHGTYLVDKKTGREYLDFFTFFASLPIGHNHPGLLEQDFLKILTGSAVNKPSNSDIYTCEMAEFVETFSRVAMPDHMKYLFFISGGALAVENALKVSMDWKVRLNYERGYTKETGHEVIHFRNAFHGRSGYTLSLTNTFDPRKYQYFPRFDWPRVDTPKLTFPVTDEVLRRVQEEEKESLDQIGEAIEEKGDHICSLIIEPIQGEGGDTHFRPEFMKALRSICDQNDILLIYDEIQTGMGLTGKMWAYEHYDAPPDIIVFGKKSQVCGIISNDRVDTVHNNCFNESSRINSTWGGSLVDMVRARRVLEIIEDEDLVGNAARVGDLLMGRLQELGEEHPFISNIRGRGLMCAFDLESPEKRDAVVNASMKKGLLILKCGGRSIRFRPPLNVSQDEVDRAMDILEKVI